RVLTNTTRITATPGHQNMSTNRMYYVETTQSEKKVMATREKLSSRTSKVASRTPTIHRQSGGTFLTPDDANHADIFIRAHPCDPWLNPLGRGKVRRHG